MITEPGQAEQVVADFERHLLELDPGLQQLHISPGGSFFSKREIDAITRRAIVRACGVFPFLTTLGMETRPGELDDESLKDTIDAMPTTVRHIFIGFGLEARSDLIREVAVNKGYGTDEVLHARDVIERVNATQSRVRISFETYVMVKPLFLTEAEAIDEAVRTVEWSYRHGADAVAVFLNTVKDATLQDYMADVEDLPWPVRFETPYYRTGIEVMRRLSASERERTVLLGLQSGVMARTMPRGCDLCTPLLVGAIMAHNFTRDPAVLEWTAHSKCLCSRAWRDEVDRQCSVPLIDRIESGLRVLERDLLPGSVRVRLARKRD